jgi:hypothetical protein
MLVALKRSSAIDGDIHGNLQHTTITNWKVKHILSRKMFELSSSYDC